MILVTGGAGFIGSNFLYHLKRNFNDDIVCVDSLTYASNYNHIAPLIEEFGIAFEPVDITNFETIQKVFKHYKPNVIVNFAAETHVDNSIKDSSPFIMTNVLGTVNLLNHAMNLDSLDKFIHVSTDEVYGSLELDDQHSFTEYSQYQTNSPYSASKASSDHFVEAYGKTYGLPTIITNCSNNYGPNQHSEKFIPTIINSVLAGKNVPVYGDGLNVRDWLYVEDHCRALELVMRKGVIGEKYNIGGGEEVANIDLVKMILKTMNISGTMIEYVKDRPGHDRRYSIDCSKIKKELGYEPKFTLEEGLKETIKWYTSGKNNGK
jgi:dTDP-glucose 4,6-dehydratase